MKRSLTNGQMFEHRSWTSTKLILYPLDAIVENQQATRYVVNFMHRKGLLQQFQHVGLEDDEDNDELIGLMTMFLGVENDGY
ncbi:hypothetical protein N7463_008264 [Penicillium fimorum]|uniref:Uncharacterized protein n=1 Tax=Penicillium fimorum TaxID=1882269 RepID=A0A9W9XNJ0_9EURO|nr:hypothetical protein N7463_008264 [Penicillium fimorum]